MELAVSPRFRFMPPVGFSFIGNFFWATTGLASPYLSQYHEHSWQKHIRFLRSMPTEIEQVKRTPVPAKALLEPSDCLSKIHRHREDSVTPQF
ncbi:hypothetical protein DFJ73DRAFT_852862 [Zopfochytrium polystomum]|nr:hypothetical protein DFJ73DRAFT_852862 [Zopfochytrium polystomum]